MLINAGLPAATNRSTVQDDYSGAAAYARPEETDKNIGCVHKLLVDGRLGSIVGDRNGMVVPTHGQQHDAFRIGGVPLMDSGLGSIALLVQVGLRCDVDNEAKLGSSA